MAGEVICELRRASPSRKSVMLKRSYASLVMVPLPMIMEAKIQAVRQSKLYYDKDADNFGIRVEEDVDTDSVADIVSFFIS